MTNYIFATVYKGKKSQFPNYSVFLIDMSQKPQFNELKGIDEQGLELSLAPVGEYDEVSNTYGYHFSYGATGIISLGDGYFYFSQNYKSEKGYGTNIKIYQYNKKDGFQEGGI